MSLAINRACACQTACHRVSVLDQILAISNGLCLSMHQESDGHSLQSSHSIGPYCIHAPDLVLNVDQILTDKCGSVYWRSAFTFQLQMF